MVTATVGTVLAMASLEASGPGGDGGPARSVPAALAKGKYPWYDPEGDAFVLQGAAPVDAGAPVSVVPMGNGRVAIRHTDPNAAGTNVPVQITVADVHGATTEATLDVRIASSAGLDVSPVAVTT